MSKFFLTFLHNVLNNCDHACEDDECYLIKIAGRGKNLDFLYEKAMVIPDVCDILKSLNEADYIKGPEPDHLNKDDQIYVYKKCYKGFEIYIKLKYKVFSNAVNEEEGKIIIISFHESTPMDE
jgi:hypothetical protein